MQRINYMKAILQWQTAVSEIRRIQLLDQEAGFLTPATADRNQAWFTEVMQSIEEHVAEADGQQLTEYGTHVDLPPNYRPTEGAAPSATEEPRRSPQARALALANTRVTQQQHEIQLLTHELRMQTRHAQTRISGLERDNEGLKRDNDDLLRTNRELLQENRRAREAFRQVGIEPPAYSAGLVNARESSRNRSRSPYREPGFGSTRRYRQRSPVGRREGAPHPPPRAEISRPGMMIRFGRRQEPANEPTSLRGHGPVSLVFGRREPATPSQAPNHPYIRRREQGRSIGASGQRQDRERPFASTTPRDQARNRSRMPDWQPAGEPASRRSGSRQRAGNMTTWTRSRAERTPPEQRSQERHPMFGGLAVASYPGGTTAYEEGLTEGGRLCGRLAADWRR
ncbi:hypothetical protein B0J12DRAFT_170695 [Macrophomina phaseolina]|uniref:Uncharacterized protein n=1 Tax=Macrophomina phaseolina TaxID=35725 RepID=A0ABQ8GTC7_9PEZI|nr:hypothetical protein B0J12DRAFT_170695 [Macrophomina phaseolina]